MALNPQIAALKSSGVYRFEYDKSQTVSIPSSQLRLIVGVSKKGPFNTPVYIPDSGYFNDIFGDIDRTLERKGSYFHRTCLAALERGPIIALNLLRLNNTEGSEDVVDDISYSTSCTANNDVVSKDNYQGFYNIEKFWFPDEESFLNNITTTTNKLFNLVNVGDKPLTVIVRKAANIKGFDVTAKEWYGINNIPTYLHADDYLSDFMVDVIVIGGDFGPKTTDAYPYEKYSSDPLLSKYFDRSKGIKRKLSVTDVGDTSLDEFLAMPEITHIATYTGCLLPDFIDLNKNNMYIEQLINADTAKTGLMCAINKDYFDTGDLVSGVDGGIDLIGHNLEYEQPKTINFLSYKETIKTDLTYTKAAPTLKTLDLTGAVITDGTAGTVIFAIDKAVNETVYNVIADASFRANDISTNKVVGTYVYVTGLNNFAPVITKQITATTALFEIDNTGGIDSGDFSTSVSYLNYSDLNYVVDSTSGAATGKILAGYNSTLYTDIFSGILTDGDKAVWDANSDNTAAAGEVVYLDFTISDSNIIVYKSGNTYLNAAINNTLYNVSSATIDFYSTPDFTIGSEVNVDLTKVFFDSSDVANVVGTLLVQTLKGSLNNTIPATATSTSNVVTVSSTYAGSISVGDYLVNNTGGLTGPSRLTRITKIVANGNTLTITTVGKILLRTIGGQATIELYKPVTQWVDYYTTVSLGGFTHTSYHLPDGTQDQVDNILYDTLSGTKLYEALIDIDNITYRYIVDTFDGGIQNNSKSILSNLAKNRKNALAILNAPSMKNFKNSKDPSFIDATGSVSSRLIGEGGDLSKNPNTVYSMPSIANGANYAAFYGPYVMVRDRGNNIVVPPAGYVSNNFLDKYVTALPWSTVAGARRGIISGRGVTGLEYNLTKTDRDYLEPFGINPIIYQNGTGIVIFGNNTAQQNIQSALSSVHVREVLIYIQDGIAAILKNFVFEFNTPQNRLEIKTLADNFLSQIKADGGVYDFKNIMDETNNTSEVIDAKRGILDTYIEPVRAMGILVHRTTILKTGAIATGEYI